MSTKTYHPSLDDPLLRINLQCITIVCSSMPFYASNIRSLFHKINLPINRSLHFHPKPGKEMYYIEVQTKDVEIINRVIDQIKNSYSKIQSITRQFPIFQNKLDTIKELKGNDKISLIQWLMKKV